MQFWSSVGILVTMGLALDGTARAADVHQHTQTSAALHAKLLDRCCQVGRERAIESGKFNCKLSARDALINTQDTSTLVANRNLLILSADSMLERDPNFSDQCEMVLESCCLAVHRTKNCDSGKQFAKSGTSCMDVELSKEATVATESFNDCCMACSLGILAARTGTQNETRATNRCKLISPLASSMSGQLYEQTYTECCQEDLPRPSSALHEPGAPIDCAQANACAHRCVPSGTLDAITRRPIGQDKCDCFTGYKLAPDEVTCVDIDECKLNLHTCNRQTEICDNTRGSFRCLARLGQQQNVIRPLVQQQQHHQHAHFNYHHSHHSQHSHQLQHQQQPTGRSLSLEHSRGSNEESHENSNGNTDSIERPFASLRLKPAIPVRW